MAVDFKALLAKSKDKWNASKQQAKTLFEKVPEGEYVFKSGGFTIVPSNSSGNLMIKRKHIVMDGDHKGASVYDNMMIETDLGMAFIRRWLEIVGVTPPDNPEELVDICAELTKNGYIAKGSVKHSGEYVNVRIEELISTSSNEELKPNLTEIKAEKGTESDSDDETEVDLDTMDRRMMKFL